MSQENTPAPATPQQGRGRRSSGGRGRSREGSSGTSTGTPARTTPPSRQQTVNGITLRIRATASTAVAQEEILHRKEDRARLTAEKRSDLFNQAVKQAHTKYELINLQFKDEDKLDDTYNLDIRIRKTRNAMTNYDMHDIFNIVIPDENSTNGAVLSIKNLFQEYATITIDEVVTSNRWYSSWAADPWIQENMTLTFKFFENNVSDELWEKTFARYTKFESEAKGGPLFFILMIHQLLSNSEEASAMLERQIRNFNISQIPGEDVDKAVSRLNGAITRLSQIKNKVDGNLSDQDYFEEIARIVLRVMQTTSVVEFNSVFSLIEQQRRINNVVNYSLRTSNQATNLTYEHIFSIAENTYRDLVETGKWTGITPNEATFVTRNQPSGDHQGAKGQQARKPPECWNCGERMQSAKEPEENRRKSLQVPRANAGQ